MQITLGCIWNLRRPELSRAAIIVLANGASETNIEKMSSHFAHILHNIRRLRAASDDIFFSRRFANELKIPSLPPSLVVREQSQSAGITTFHIVI